MGGVSALGGWVGAVLVDWWSLWRGLMVFGSSVGGVVKELVDSFSRKE